MSSSHKIPERLKVAEDVSRALGEGVVSNGSSYRHSREEEWKPSRERSVVAVEAHTDLHRAGIHTSA
jgi:hypothetical protein